MKDNKTNFSKFQSEGKIESTRASYYYPPASKSLKFVANAISNPYLREQIINLMPQIFSGRPDITVTKIGDIEPDEKLTEEYDVLFKKVKAYQSMQITYQDTLYFGASIKSVGFEKEGNDVIITEIRDLPALSFSTGLFAANVISPNPLMEGICMRNDKVIVVQTDPLSFDQTILKNVIIIRRPGTPYPAGEAYCLPIYPVIAEIDKVVRALNMKVERIGKPIIMPKISDDFNADTSKLEDWFKEFSPDWGRKRGFLLPRGIELAEVNIYESEGGEERLACLADLIAKFFNPTTTLDKDGQSIISATDSGKTAIWHAYIISQQEWIEEEYEKIFNQLLKYNGYDDYEVNIEMPRPSIDRSQIKIQQIQMSLQHNLITKEEARNLMDTLDLPPLTPEIEEELNKSIKPVDVEMPRKDKYLTRSEDKPNDTPANAIENINEIFDTFRRDPNDKTIDEILEDEGDPLTKTMKDISEWARRGIEAVIDEDMRDARSGEDTENS